MTGNPFVPMLQHTKQYFDRSTACLDEADSSFRPAPGMFSVAEHVAHVARTVDWFLEGGFSPKGFRVDWEAMEEEVRAVTGLEGARAWLDRAFSDAVERFAAATPDDLMTPIAAGPVLGGEPRTVIVPGIAEHTAHHRGALTVYARLRGKIPEMPYT